jgi:hypothetical protein
VFLGLAMWRPVWRFPPARPAKGVVLPPDERWVLDSELRQLEAV